jgi:glycerate 2-kinase
VGPPDDLAHGHPHGAVLAQRRAWLRAIFDDTLARLDPAARTEAALAALDWPASSLVAPGVTPAAPVIIVAAGKAAPAMAAGALRYLARSGPEAARGVAGVVIGVIGARGAEPCAPLAFHPASHPVPDARSVSAARAALAAVQHAPAGAAILALISGGASALMALPAPGIELADKVAVVRAVAASGADIRALNAVRKHLSAIKGGQLAARAAASVTTLVASDVIGDDLAAVGSGPTVPDPTTFAEARDIVAAAMDWASVPASVRAHLDAGCAGQRAETPRTARPGDRAVLVAGTAALVEAARDACARGSEGRPKVPGDVHGGVAGDVRGSLDVIDGGTRALAGDVAAVADRLVHQAHAMEAAAAGRGRARACWVGGGEATIALPPQPGVGGRAQHIALLVARAIAGTRHVSVLVAGSDGIDGSSPAAGAIVDGQTWSAMRAAGCDPEAALARCDAFPVLDAVGATVCTGPTGVNHADLALIAAGTRPAPAPG